MKKDYFFSFFNKKFFCKNTLKYSVILSALLSLSHLYSNNGESFSENLVKKNVENIPKEISEIADELRCPTCKGMSIQDSQTLQSVAMLNEVKKQVKLGKSKEEILSYFRDRYGEWILRKPDPYSSLGLAIWLLPLIGLVIGPLVVFLALFNSQKKFKREREKIKEELRAFMREIKGNAK